MIDLGDEFVLPNGMTASVVGWQRMLGQNTEWCLRWWTDDGPVDVWLNKAEIDRLDNGENCNVG